MKKKVLAFLLASAMIIEPFSVASAADFSDGMGQDTVQFRDDAEDVPEVETEFEDVNQFSTDVAGEDKNSSKPSEDAIQMGDDVWFRFDEATGIVTISGTGDMWDYYDNGYDYTNKHQNPFISKHGIKKVVIADGITSVGDNLIYQYSGRDIITEISLGKDIKRIGNYAFYRFDENPYFGIRSISLPVGLEEIGKYAFANWYSLESVEIPDSVKILGDSCFSSCNNLKIVKLSCGLKSIGSSVFSACSSLATITLPSGLESIGDNAFFRCSNLVTITFPSGLESIGNSAFSRCSSITTITIPSGLESIGNSAFGYCDKLTTVNFEDGFSCSISSWMFENCTSLTEIIIPKKVPHVDTDAFLGCSRLTTVTVEGSSTDIDSYAFNNCPNLRTIKSYDCSYTKKYYDSLTDSQKKQIKFESLGEGTHQFTANKVPIKNPTCTEKGIKAYKCEICGATKEEEEILAYGHDWDEGVVTKEPTETESGEIKYTCYECGETKIEKIPKLSAVKFDYVNFKWNLYDKANINGRANKAISYYITTVDKNSSAPEYDVTHDTQGSSQDGYFGIDITMPDEEVDVYIFAADTEGNHTYYKVTPNYNNRPQKPSNIVKVGDNITATVEGNQIILTGTGATYDYDEYSGWYFGRLDRIKKITIDKRINYIGKYFLAECTGIEEIEFPEGIQRLGECVLGYSTNVKKIVFPSTLEEIP